MARVVVDVMPKQEILDPQGKAVTGALARLGFEGLSVRQGKRFEIEVAGEVTEAVLAQIRSAAEKLLANTVIEDFTVYAAPAPEQGRTPQQAAALQQSAPQQTAPRPATTPRPVPTQGTAPQPRPVQQAPRPGTGGQQQ